MVLYCTVIAAMTTQELFDLYSAYASIIIYAGVCTCTLCTVLLCLVCVFDLACFYLSSFSSLIKTCIIICVCMSAYNVCVHIHVHVGGYFRGTTTLSSPDMGLAVSEMSRL